MFDYFGLYFTLRFQVCRFQVLNIQENQNPLKFKNKSEVNVKYVYTTVAFISNENMVGMAILSIK